MAVGRLPKDEFVCCAACEFTGSQFGEKNSKEREGKRGGGGGGGGESL